jgi:hypothetical protein
MFYQEKSGSLAFSSSFFVFFCFFGRCRMNRSCALYIKRNAWNRKTNIHMLANELCDLKPEVDHKNRRKTAFLKSVKRRLEKRVGTASIDILFREGWSARLFCCAKNTTRLLLHYSQNNIFRGVTCFIVHKYK